MLSQSEASTELYSGRSPWSGNRFGSMPSETTLDHSRRISPASSSRPVARPRRRGSTQLHRPPDSILTLLTISRPPYKPTPGSLLLRPLNFHTNPADDDT